MASQTRASETQGLESRIGRIEELVTQLEEVADPATRQAAEEVVAAVLELHGAGLARIVEIVEHADGGRLLSAFAGDELVASLLLLHSLHPVALETRVADALTSVRPRLGAHGGDVALVGVDDGVVRLRLLGSCDGCPASATTLQDTVERAILAAAPDVVRIDVDTSGAAPRAEAPGPCPAPAAAAPAARAQLRPLPMAPAGAHA